MQNSIAFTAAGFNLLVIALPVAAIVLFRWPRLLPYVMSLFFGLLIGFIDTQTKSVQLPALFLTSFGFFIAFSRPKQVWMYALLLAMWIPIAHVAQSAAGVVSPEPLGAPGIILPFVFSFIGSYAALAVRRAAAKLNLESAGSAQEQ